MSGGVPYLVEVVRVYFFGGGSEVAVLDFHIVVGFVEYLSKDDELFYVGVDHVLESVFDHHSVVNDVDDQTLALDV